MVIRQGAMMATRKTALKKTSTKGPAKISGPEIGGRRSSKSSAETYTMPELRDRIRKKVLAGDKGGGAGQWSARKAQLVAQEYAAKGGEYRQVRNAAQRSLRKWGEEN